MNLTIDIGNTRSKFAAFSGDELVRTDTGEGHALSSLTAFVGTDAVEAAIVSSVVDLPDAARAVLDSLPCPVLTLTSATPVPLVNLYRTPQTLGTDRLAAAVGAAALAPHRTLLIIDAGSCVTFDMVTAAGEYVGGNIAPGIEARLRAIGDYFPRLPHVAAVGDVPELGYDTETAIRAGVIPGIRNEIEGCAARLSRRHPDLLVFITGGDTGCLHEDMPVEVRHEPYCVPIGLNRILRYNINLQHTTNNR